ncbi:MAG: tRNA(His) guanylyltransferase Thg1 family protein [Bacilli bacterium]|nr:tRNA(His) guanylyltransferase Thg1 family protein [Bacilli bacterium]
MIKKNILNLDKELEKINVMDETKSLGNRMKEYENLTRFYLPKDNCIIIRIDGNAFHTFTRGFKKPFDRLLKSCMEETAKYLVENIPGAQMAYHQSDEISVLVTPFKLNNSEQSAWFDNNLNKLVSITASMATLKFNQAFSFSKASSEWEKSPPDIPTLEELSVIRNIRNSHMIASTKGALFDSRAFVLPEDEVINYFIWRQQDAIKNSISMVAQSLFSHKSLQGLNGKQMIERMKEDKSVDFELGYSTSERRGSVVTRLEPVEEVKTIVVKGQEKEIKFTRRRWGIDYDIPVFKDNREYIEKFLK